MTDPAIGRFDTPQTWMVHENSTIVNHAFSTLKVRTGSCKYHLENLFLNEKKNVELAGLLRSSKLVIAIPKY